MASQNTERQPGPNDFHIDDEGKLRPGLGKDEPTAVQKKQAKDAGVLQLEALRADIEAKAADVDGKLSSIAERERALAAREAVLNAAMAMAEGAVKPAAGPKK